MHKEPSDILHIQPVNPEAAQGNEADATFDVKVATDARAKIASVPVAPAAPLATEHTNSYFNPANPPISPAASYAKKHRPRKQSAHPIVSAVISFLLLIMLFKAPVVYSQIKYLSSRPAINTTDENAPKPPAPAVVSPEPVLTIPKISIKSPIVFETSTEEAAIQKALHGGVVHYGSSALPGRRGNTVIVGHSSNDWWEAGDYKFVFVLLDKMIVGDTFTLNFESKQYTYEVTTAKVVEANDVSVLAYTSEPTVTLITCWPAGTNLKRFVIQAKQTTPYDFNDGSAKPKVATPSTTKLPGNSPTMIDQIQRFWQSLKDAMSQKPTTVTGKAT